jgi:cell division septation protein DedD
MRGDAALERDVEAPEIFSKQDKGLWDGRPSLGGVWVAHPDVKAPERVIIRNTESGRETVGALFKRERMNPGPVFQVSAEAASAIGMLAGAPTDLDVVALRTVEVQPDPPAADPAPAEADMPEQASLPEEPPVQEDAAPVAPPADAPADSPLIAIPEDEQPQRRGFLARLFGRGDAAPDAAITSQPLDGAAETAANVAPDIPAIPPAPSPSTLDQPFVQIGIFSVEANARSAARTMENAGLSARVTPGRTQGNAFWRVTVGPAATTAERGQTLARVRELGFADAYPVRR